MDLGGTAVDLKGKVAGAAGFSAAFSAGCTPLCVAQLASAKGSSMIKNRYLAGMGMGIAGAIRLYIKVGSVLR